MNLRSIISPVDFSEQSRHALRWASAIAGHHQSRLTVVTVIEQLLADAARIRFGENLAKAETEALRQFVADAWPHGPGPSAQLVLRTLVGHPAAFAILEAARS